MTPFKAAAVVAILIAGAGSARADSYYAIDNSAGGVAVSSTGFGGFANAADFTGYSSTYSLDQGGVQGCTDSGLPTAPTATCKSYFEPITWAPAGSVQTPTTYALTNKNVLSGSEDPTFGTTVPIGSSNIYAMKVQNFTGLHSPTPPDNTPSIGWSYIGLQNLSVVAGDWVTVTAKVHPTLAGSQDLFGIVYGPTGSLTATNAATPTLPDTSSPITDINNWITETFTFQAPTANIDINFGFDLTNGQQDSVYLAHVDIEYVPEPASLALLGAGLLGLGLVRRRQRG